MKDMAAFIARAIFESGSVPHDKAQRIQFMGGKYPDWETALGGYGEHGLTDCIRAAISDFTLLRDSQP